MGRIRYFVSSLLLVLPLAAVAQAAGDPFAELDRATAGSDSKSNKATAQDFDAYRKAQQQAFGSYKDLVQKEFQAFAELNARVSGQYQARVAKVWSEPEQSNKTRWVQYENDYQEKRVVDFDKGVITISSPKGVELSREKAGQAVAELLAMTSRDAFRADEVASEVEAESRARFETIETAELEDRPVMFGYLLGNQNASADEKRRLVEDVVGNGEQTKGVEAGQEVLSWSFSMTDKGSPEEQGSDEKVSSQPVRNTKLPDLTMIGERQQASLPARARPFVAAINRENREFGLSSPLILAIMETESAFNPMARSPIPAFGLMQIVPASAGQDATEKLFGQARLLAPSFLYNPENNIRVGAAYFNILYYRYFRGVDDPLSRLYCAIAAYNTGPGNVSRALTGASMALKPAIKIANTMTPDELYQHLLGNLPYEETVNYLRKVTSRLAKYEEVMVDG